MINYNPYLAAAQQGNQMSGLGLQMQMLQWANAIKNNPQATPEQRAYAEQIEGQALQMAEPTPIPATPFGLQYNFRTGAIGPKSGPYSPGQNYEDMMNSGQMDFGFWGQQQAAHNPTIAKIYDTANKNLAKAQNYISGLDKQYPTTTFADGRQMQPSQDAKAQNEKLKQDYLNSLPAWARKDLDIASGKLPK